MQVLARLHPPERAHDLAALVACPLIDLAHWLQCHHLLLMLLCSLSLLPIRHGLFFDKEDLIYLTDTVLALGFKSGCVLVAEQWFLLLLLQLVGSVEEVVAPPIVL